MTLRPGSRCFVLWMAHLALMVYVAQIVAIDHWHADPADAVGIPNSNAHVTHCHGTSSCAEGGALTPASLAAALTPLPPEPRLYSIAPSVASPVDAFVDTLLEPPRAA